MDETQVTVEADCVLTGASHEDPNDCHTHRHRLERREPDSLNQTASWVIRNKATHEVIMETFDTRKVNALNTAKYEAVPIYDYLQEVNRGTR